MRGFSSSSASTREGWGCVTADGARSAQSINAGQGQGETAAFLIAVHFEPAEVRGVGSGGEVYLHDRTHAQGSRRLLL